MSYFSFTLFLWRYIYRIITAEKPCKCPVVISSVSCTPQTNVAEGLINFLPDYFGEWSQQKWEEVVKGFTEKKDFHFWEFITKIINISSFRTTQNNVMQSPRQLLQFWLSMEETWWCKLLFVHLNCWKLEVVEKN